MRETTITHNATFSARVYDQGMPRCFGIDYTKHGEHYLSVHAISPTFDGAQAEASALMRRWALDDQIKTLRDGFGKVARMDPDGPIYARLCDILDQADDATLIAARNANIKWVSSLALNRCIRRGIN